MTEHERSIHEVWEDLQEIKAAIAEMRVSSLSRDVYEAHQGTMRTEMHLEFQSIRRELSVVEEKASNAQTIALWSLGLFSSAVLAGIVALLIAWTSST